jgi:hypothetical protein
LQPIHVSSLRLYEGEIDDPSSGDVYLARCRLNSSVFDGDVGGDPKAARAGGAHPNSPLNEVREKSGSNPVITRGRIPRCHDGLTPRW